MVRNTINRPFHFSAKFNTRKCRYSPNERLLRNALWIIALVAMSALILDDVARAAGL